MSAALGNGGHLRRQPASHFEPAAIDRLHADRSAMQVDEMLDQCQAEPGAALVAGYEAVKAGGALVGLKADSIVPHTEHYHVAGALRRNHDFAAGFGKAQRVRDEVEQDLLDPSRIAANGSEL